MQWTGLVTRSALVLFGMAVGGVNVMAGNLVPPEPPAGIWNAGVTYSVREGGVGHRYVAGIGSQGAFSHMTEREAQNIKPPASQEIGQAEAARLYGLVARALNTLELNTQADGDERPVFFRWALTLEFKDARWSTLQRLEITDRTGAPPPPAVKALLEAVRTVAGAGRQPPIR